MQDFLDEGYLAQVTTTWTDTEDLINDYYSGKRLDFTLTEGKDRIQKLSVHTNYGCTSGNFASDSWIPTNQAGA